MAELIGALASGITLAGLFRICVDAFGIIRTCKNQERDLKKLTLRLNIERCRLYNWGEAMRLTGPDKQKSPLDDYDQRIVVQGTLEMIFQLLNDTQKIESKYGCRQTSDLKDANNQPIQLEGPEESPVTVLAASFSNFGNLTNQKPQSLHKTRWVVNDRKKFGSLLLELKDLVDGLQDITERLISTTRLESMMRKAIRSIRDVDTLTLVSEVTEEHHPDLSVAASNKAETVSMPASTWQDIADWTKGVRVSDGAQVDIAEELEEMSITELKERVLRNHIEQQHKGQERGPPPREHSMHERPPNSQHPSMPANNQTPRPETSEQALQHAAYHRPQDQVPDHTLPAYNLSPQQMYELHAFRLQLEASAADEAAMYAAAYASKKKESAGGEHLEKKAPIMFHDAYHRSYKLPFELCAKWRSMENMIVQAHQGFDAADLVQQRRYDLIGPSGEVIMPQVWDIMVEPGFDITLKPWPAPEPSEPEPPPPPETELLDENILTLDDILNPKKGVKMPTGKPKKTNGGFVTWMSGGMSSRSVSGRTSTKSVSGSTSISSGRTSANSGKKRR